MPRITTKVVNRVNNNALESNLVYPCDKGYYCTAQLDRKWVLDAIKSEYTREVTDIHNKYAVSIRTNIGSILVYNHDGIFWLIDTLYI